MLVDQLVGLLGRDEIEPPAAFERVGATEAHALEQARVARILREGEYDPATGDLYLWEPGS